MRLLLVPVGQGHSRVLGENEHETRPTPLPRAKKCIRTKWQPRLGSAHIGGKPLSGAGINSGQGIIVGMAEVKVTAGRERKVGRKRP